MLYAPLPLYQPLKSISFLPDILSFGITGELRHEKKLTGSKVSSVAGGRRKHTGPSMSSSPTRWSGNSTLIMAQTTISSNLGNTCARSYVAVPRSPIQLRDVKRYEPAMTIWHESSGNNNIFVHSQEIEGAHVNICDLLDYHRSGNPVPLFNTEAELVYNTRRSKKIWPRKDIKEGNILKFLLRRIFWECGLFHMLRDSP